MPIIERFDGTFDHVLVVLPLVLLQRKIVAAYHNTNRNAAGRRILGGLAFPLVVSVGFVLVSTGGVLAKINGPIDSFASSTKGTPSRTESQTCHGEAGMCGDWKTHKYIYLAQDAVGLYAAAAFYVVLCWDSFSMASVPRIV